MGSIPVLLSLCIVVGSSQFRLAECAMLTAESSQQSAAVPPPEVPEVVQVVAVVGVIFCNDMWLTYLKSHPKLREFRQQGGRIQHVSEGLFTPDFSFTNSWNVECTVPPFQGSAADLDEIIRTFNISDMTMQASKEKPLQGSFLAALNHDPLHAVNLTNVVLDKEATRILADNADQLAELRLRCPALDDSQLAELNRCRSLHSLEIMSDRITDQSLTVLVEGAPRLCSMELSSSGINGRFLSKLAGEMFWLRLDDCAITDEALKSLPQIPNIEVFSIRHAVNVTDAGIKDVSSLKMLTGLDVTGTKISKVGLLSLSKLESLDTMVLDDCKGINDDCIETLVAFPSITRLSIQNTSLTEAGVMRLREKLPDCKISVSVEERWVDPFTGTVFDLN